MADGWITAAIGAAAGFITAAVGYAGFWLKVGGSVQEAKGDGINALQMAAENAERVKELAKEIDDLRRDSVGALERASRVFTETVDQVRREFGQTVEAIRSKVHSFETWSRDEFMRKQSFRDAVSQIETAQARRDEQLDRRLDRFEQKLDRVVSTPPQA